MDVGVFAPFDYVALGHIHGPQKVGRDTVRYSGTPLKYSLSEAKHHKFVTVIDIPENKKIELRTVELVPMRDLREIKGTFAELTDKAYYEGTPVEDYIYVLYCHTTGTGVILDILCLILKYILHCYRLHKRQHIYIR